MLNNPFIRAVGVAAIAYLIFQSLTWALFAFAQIAGSLAYWIKWNFVPWSEEVAITPQSDAKTSEPCEPERASPLGASHY